MKKKKALLVYTSLSSFVKTDYEILSKRYNVTKYQFNSSKKLFKMIFEQLKLKIFLLLNIWKCDFMYCWFADYHSFLPILFGKIIGKKTFLVLGGYDVTYIPELKYGSFSNPIRKFCAKYSIKYATLNLSVSDNIKRDALERVPKAKIQNIYTGYSKDKFSSNNIVKKNVVLSVGSADTLQRIKIKGIDFFIEVARKMPNYKFIVVGVSEKALRFLNNVPINVEIIGKIEQERLIKYYQKAKVYAQFSIREGLPNAICESMLCECIPVGFNNGGIPIAIGDCGFILDEKNVNKAIEMIQKAMNSSDSRGREARGRIIDNFSLENREREIIKIL